MIYYKDACSALIQQVHKNISLQIDNERNKMPYLSRIFENF